MPESWTGVTCHMLKNPGRLHLWIVAVALATVAVVLGTAHLLHIAAVGGTLVAVAIYLARDPQPAGGADARLLPFLAIAVFLIASTAIWAKSGRTLVTRDVGESFAIYLLGNNARDFLTTIVADHAANPDPAAHPFFYIHQPNIPARLLSTIAQFLRIDLGDQIFCNLLLTGFGLALAYKALRDEISPWFALLVVAFLAVNSTIFYEASGDLARGIHYFLFFASLRSLSLNPGLANRGHNFMLAALVVAAALSDFAWFIFHSAFVIAWVIYRSGGIHWRRLAGFVVLPASAAYAFYFACVIAAVGWSFFLFDVAFTYLGRAGQFTGDLYKRFTGDLTGLQVMEVYREHNVVLWARAWQPWGLGDVFDAWRSSLVFSLDGLAIPVIVIAAVTLLHFFARARWAFLGALAAVAAGVLSWFKLVMPVVLLVPLFAFIWASTRRPAARRLPAALGAASAFGAAIAVSVLAACALFPEYAINFLLLGKRPPAPLLEAAVFAWFGLTVLLAAQALFARRAAALAIFGIPALIPLAVAVAQDVRAYRKAPPSAPPYTALLSQEAFRGASFLSTHFYGMPWYYTRGWTNMSESGNPPKSVGYNVNLLHMADWKNREKYSKPQYFLCDMSQYGGSHTNLDPAKCHTPGKCDCGDVADFLVAKGHRIVHSEPVFSILSLNHDKQESPSK